MRDIKMDFVEDVSEILRNQMKREGFNPQVVDKSEDAINLFFQSRRMSIPAMPRNVCKPSGFNTMGHDYIVSKLEDIFRKGEETSPYRSRGYQFLKKDHLLDYLGMHHLHLGEEIEKDGFSKRTNHLLIVFVEYENAYFLKVSPHAEDPIPVWYQQELMDIINENWPELRERLYVKGASNVEPKVDNEFIRSTRNTNLVALYESYDGTVYLPHGTIIETHAVISRDRCFKSLKRAEKEIRAKANELVQNARHCGVHFQEEMSIKIIGFDSLGTSELFHIDLMEEHTKFRFRHQLR